MRRRVVISAALALLPATAAAGARLQQPVVIEKIVRHVNNDIVTQLDVRQAKLLKLLPDTTSDAAVIDQLVLRRLMIAYVAGASLPEPAAADVAARRARWEASLGAGAGVAARVAAAGMTSDQLDGWLRDDLRIEAYENRNLSGALPTRDEIATYYRDHASDYAAPDGSLAPLDDPKVEADVRAHVSAAKRQAAIERWQKTLLARAEIY